jgi:chaperonin GroEL
LILVTDHKIDLVEDIYPTLEIIARDNRPLVIVAEEVEGQALASLIMNTTRGSLRIVAVKAPRYGEERRNILKDLCVSTGAQFVSRASGMKLKEVKLEHLGACKTIEVARSLTTIVDGKGSYKQVEAQIEDIKSQIKEEDDMRLCAALQERITRLASGIAIINVGAPTEVEMIEKKHRIEDALEAVKAAQEEGTLPGGGIALVRASSYLQAEGETEDQDLGIEIVRQAIKAPLRQMAINAGESPDIILNIVEAEEGHIGYDFSTGSTVDMFEEGIVDPARVTRVALQNAASAASTLITTGHAIIEV